MDIERNDARLSRNWRRSFSDCLDVQPMPAARRLRALALAIQANSGAGPIIRWTIAERASHTSPPKFRPEVRLGRAGMGLRLRAAAHANPARVITRNECQNFRCTVSASPRSCCGRVAAAHDPLSATRASPPIRVICPPHRRPSRGYGRQTVAARPQQAPAILPTPAMNSAIADPAHALTIWHMAQYHCRATTAAQVRGSATSDAGQSSTQLGTRRFGARPGQNWCVTKPDKQ